MHNFIHLRVHSEYSVVDSLVRLGDLLQATAEQGMPAIALTDMSNLFGLVKFYTAARKHGIKPIMGAEVWLQHPDEKQPQRVVLLCQNQQGYANLTRLITRAYQQGQRLDQPTVELDWMQPRDTEGLIMLSGGLEGDLAGPLLQDDKPKLKQRIEHWKRLFPQRYYLELQRTGKPDDRAYMHAAINAAERFEVPVVATNTVCFMKADDFEAHEARVCINQGRVLGDPQRPRDYTAQQYLRSAQEMAELFADYPEALQNTIEIAKRCNVSLTLDQHFLPEFPVPQGMTVEKYFEDAAEKGLMARWADWDESPTDEQKQLYQRRLHMELKIINSMGFPGYFLIVADFIRWAKRKGIPVGPGRGSGAGSLVAYVLDITDLDPIKHSLLFERFLNPERVSMPDFDVDFCMEGRDRVIEYVADKYGRDNVAQIITYGTMAAKAVIRDVGRVLGHPYGFVDTLAKLIPMELGMTLTKALQQEEALRTRYEEEEEVTALIDMALKLEGLTRNVGKHAGGVVIAPQPLTCYTPLYCEPDGSSLVTQFDKDDIEAIGLVKFDFLGLRTLTIIDWAVKTINSRRPKEEAVDIRHISLQDEKTFDLLKACHTTAVFQLESRGMKDLVKRLQPDCFDDIVALVALFRPGPLQSGMVDDYIDRKHGHAKVIYPHELLGPVLKPTYGVFLYQEQVMQSAQVLSGYTLGGADLLRRAMGKKKPAEMAKQRALFTDGAEHNNVDKKLANQIFDTIEKFAGYGFNKSHSVAYALLAYQTAWLKAHYPAAFMAAVLSSDMDNTDKVVIFVEECWRMKMKVVSPDVNKGTYAFTVDGEGIIIYGLGAIKGVGQAAAEHIAEERERNGLYQNLLDFCQRIDGRRINRRVLEALCRSGALDSLGEKRSVLFYSIEKALHQAEQYQRDQAQGQQNLFAGLEAVSDNSTQFSYVQGIPWGDKERLQGEKDTLGLYLSGHPMQAYRSELQSFGMVPIRELHPDRTPCPYIAGYVQSVRTLLTRHGKRIAFVSLDDGTGRVDIGVFGKLYNDQRELLVKDSILVIQGECAVDDYSGGMKITANALTNLDQLRRSRPGRILISVADQGQDAAALTALRDALRRASGGQWQVWLQYQNDQAKGHLRCGDNWRVVLSDELLTQLQAIDHLDVIDVRYG